MGLGFQKKENLMDDISNTYWCQISKKGKFDRWHKWHILMSGFQKGNFDRWHKQPILGENFQKRKFWWMAWEAHFGLELSKGGMVIDDISNRVCCWVFKKGNFDGWHKQHILMADFQKRKFDGWHKEPIFEDNFQKRKFWWMAWDTHFGFELVLPWTESTRILVQMCVMARFGLLTEPDKSFPFVVHRKAIHFQFLYNTWYVTKCYTALQRAGCQEYYEKFRSFLPIFLNLMIC